MKNKRLSSANLFLEIARIPFMAKSIISSYELTCFDGHYIEPCNHFLHINVQNFKTLLINFHSLIMSTRMFCVAYHKVEFMPPYKEINE